MPDLTQPPGGGGPANPGWYPDPWGRSAWRWWDGWRWTGWISPPETVGPAIVRQITETRPFPPAAPEAPARERLPEGAAAGVGPPPPSLSPSTPLRPAPPPPTGWAEEVPLAQPATPVPHAQRRRLKIELAIVLAIFPAPAVLAALIDLTKAELGQGSGTRLPTLFPGQAGLGFVYLLIELLLPLAGGALALYLLSLPGGDGGPSSIGLDGRHPRGDAALVLVVFGICYFAAQGIVSVILANAHVTGITPSYGHFPPYYQVLDVTNGLVSSVVEEIVVLGYFIRRLEQLGTRPFFVVLAAVLLRGSYHVYYGWDVIPILTWALASVLVYRRYRRLGPFIFVHACWDTGAILTALHGAGVYGVEAAILLPSSLIAFFAWRRYLPRVAPAPISGPSVPTAGPSG